MTVSTSTNDWMCFNACLHSVMPKRFAMRDAQMHHSETTALWHGTGISRRPEAHLHLRIAHKSVSSSISTGRLVTIMVRHGQRLSLRCVSAVHVKIASPAPFDPFIYLPDSHLLSLVSINQGFRSFLRPSLSPQLLLCISYLSRSRPIPQIRIIYQPCRPSPTTTTTTTTKFKQFQSSSLRSRLFWPSRSSPQQPVSCTYTSPNAARIHGGCRSGRRISTRGA